MLRHWDALRPFDDAARMAWLRRARWSADCAPRGAPERAKKTEGVPANNLRPRSINSMNGDRLRTTSPSASGRAGVRDHPVRAWKDFDALRGYLAQDEDARTAMFEAPARGGMVPVFGPAAL